MTLREHSGKVAQLPTALGDLCAAFLASKALAVASGDIVPRTLADNQATVARLLKHLGADRESGGLTSPDFERYRATLSAWSPSTISVELARMKSIFRYGVDAGLLPVLPRWGSCKPPSKKAARVARAARGPRMFEAEEVRRLLAAAPMPLGVMVLLGCNCGFGNSDIAKLPLAAIKDGWITFPRPKTGIDRRCPLWPETLAALEVAIADRPKPESITDAGLVFLTRRGRPWVGPGRLNAVADAFGRLAASVGMKGRGFYCLRRGFQTVGSETKDEVAVSFLMGHAPKSDDMGAIYRQRIDDARLVAVTDHVRKWLLG